MHAGAILGPSERPSVPKAAPGAAITPVHDLNVPYEGTEEYETPTAEMLFPPVSISSLLRILMVAICILSSKRMLTTPGFHLY